MVPPELAEVLQPYAQLAEKMGRFVIQIAGAAGSHPLSASMAGNFLRMPAA